MTEKIDKAKFEFFELGTVADTVVKFDGIMLLDESRYTTPPICMFGEPCVNSAVKDSHLLIHPAIYFAKVSDYKMIGGAAFPIIQNKSICHQYFSTEFWETSEQATRSCYIQQDQNLIAYCNIKERHHYEFKVINLVGNGSYNYAHWMTEFLPQLVLLKKSGIDFSSYKLLVDARIFPSMVEAILLLGVKERQIVRIEAFSFNTFPQALWVSPVANVVFQRPNASHANSLEHLAVPQHAIFHPIVLQATRDVFLSKVMPQTKEKLPEKIFIKRTAGSKFHTRSVINELEIQHRLALEGFVCIDPSKLSFVEQIQQFSHAKYIVAPSGAALVNMIWAPEGAKVIVLMNDSKVANYWYFSNMAYALGHQLSYVLGKLVDTDRWADVNHADFEIDLQALISALENSGLEMVEFPIINAALDATLEMAKEHYKAGRFEQAANAYQEVLEMQPEHAEANHNLGVIEASTQDASKALARFERAVLAKPEQEQYWVSYIDSLMQSGAIDSAVDALELGVNYGLRASTAKKLAENFARNFDINRIGFLIHSLELVNHYACVWDLLPEGSFDVLLCGDAETTESTFFSNWKCNVVKVSEFIHLSIRYQYLVSNHPVNFSETPLIKQLGNINVRFMYAAGKSGWNLSEWNNLYDVILCFGPYHASIFLDTTEAVVVQMGYPRFDRYFTHQPDLDDLYARYGCDPSKKTVVWLPTWKTLSSVNYFDAEVSSLTASYNVIVKLHPLMPESEPERVEALMRYDFTCLITDASDNLPLYQIADFMLFDYGGPPLAGIYADKNFILLNVQDAANDDLTGKDSPDITIREYLANVNQADGSITQLLADSSFWEQQRTARHMLRKRYFAPYFGFSSNVAADALLNLKYMVGKGGSR